MKEPIDIEFIAQLARIELTPEEKERFAVQLQAILSHIEELQKLNVEGIEPTAHAFSIYNVFRADEAGVTFTPAEALMNAPQLPSGEKAVCENQLIVPKIVE